MRETVLAFLLSLPPAAAQKPLPPTPKAATHARPFFALSVADASASSQWYQQAFGLSVVREMKAPDGQARVILLASDQLLIELLQHRDAKPRTAAGEKGKEAFLVHSIFKVGFSVPDLEGTVAHLKTLKTAFITDIIEDKPNGIRLVLLRDPDGNTLQLHSFLAGSPANPKQP